MALADGNTLGFLPEVGSDTMTRHRKRPTLTEKLAATLCQMVRFDEAGRAVPVIPHEEAKRMTPAGVLRLFDFDHAVVPHAEGGGNEHWNLVPRLRDEHREKTAKVDVPRIAKNKRLRASQAAFTEVMEAKAGRAETPATKPRGGRPMPGSKASQFKRKFDGRVERRETAHD